MFSASFLFKKNSESPLSLCGIFFFFLFLYVHWYIVVFIITFIEIHSKKYTVVQSISACSCYKWYHGISRGSSICTQVLLSKYFTEYEVKSIFCEKKWLLVENDTTTTFNFLKTCSLLRHWLWTSFKKLFHEDTAK